MVTSFILCIIFINDRDELAIRVNAGYILKRFVDCYSSKEEPKEYIRLFKDIVLPNLKIGIRKDNEDVQTEYILVLEHIIEHSKYYTDLDDMRVLVGNTRNAATDDDDDEDGEDNFSKVLIIFNYIVDKSHQKIT